MENQSRGLVVGGHDGSFLVIDRVDMVDYVFGVRSQTGEVLSVYEERRYREAYGVSLSERQLTGLNKKVSDYCLHDGNVRAHRR